MFASSYVCKDKTIVTRIEHSGKTFHSKSDLLVYTQPSQILASISCKYCLKLEDVLNQRKLADVL